MTRPANWTTRLPRASLPSVAEVTRPIRAVLDATSGLAGPPGSQRPGRRTASLDDFAQRAIDTAEERETEAVEVRTDRVTAPRYLPAGRAGSLTLSSTDPWYPYPKVRPGRMLADLPADDGRYGVVLCIGALERYPEPLPLIIELNRILEPDGVLFLVAPLIVPEMAHGGPSSGGDRRRYGLNYLLDAAALRIEHLEPVERSSAYAVIARSSPSKPRPQQRRATDHN